MKIPLTPEAAARLTFQSYPQQPPIVGVVSSPLRKHRAHEGSFMELLRLTEGSIEGMTDEFQLRQLSLSQAIPGRINAFHLHPLAVQDELWCVLQGLMTVWLVDLRDDSPTLHNRQRHVLSGEAPAWLVIPSGVAHGYKAGPEGATLIYAMNAQFDSAHPNEGRLPWNYFGAELWEDDRG